MTGTVVCYRPRLRRGVVRTECGDELVFEATGDIEAIYGDDVVEFMFVGPETDRHARVTRVVRTAMQDSERYEGLLRDLFGGLEIERVPSN